MPALYPVVLWIHIVSAIAWVGSSMIFFSVVVVPTLRGGISILRLRDIGWGALSRLVF